MSKNISTTYLVAKYLLNNEKSYIHDLKRKCKCNNPMQRILSLRNTYNWQIETVYEGRKGMVAIYHYKLIKEGLMPKQFTK